MVIATMSRGDDRLAARKGQKLNMFTLCDISKKGARLWGTKCALVFGEQRTSYEQLELDVVAIASTLIKMGLEPGARVALLSENSDLYIKVMLGVMRAGCVPVPLNYRLSAQELSVIVDHAEPSLLVFDTISDILVRELQAKTSIRHWRCLDKEWQGLI